MALPFLVPIDLNNNEIRNVLAQLLGTNPTGVEGKLYYNTGDKTLRFYNGTAWVSLGTLDQITAPTADVSLNSHKITNLAAPTSDNDAARKIYVDDAIDTLTDAVNAAVRGLTWKESVRVATTADINLTSAPAAIDGITLTTGDRVLVKDQAADEENGIYVFNGAASAMTRALDADTADELESATVMIEEGTTQENTAWTQINDNFTLDTDPVTFAQFGSGSTVGAGAGLVLNTGNFDVNPGVGIEVVSDEVRADLGDGLEFVGNAITVDVGPGLELDGTTGEVQIENDGVLAITHGGTGASDAGNARTNLGIVNALRYATTIGNGSATSFNIDHNLGTLDVLVQVVKVSDGMTVYADTTRTTTNRVVVVFAVAPTSNQYRVVVLG